MLSHFDTAEDYRCSSVDTTRVGVKVFSAHALCCCDVHDVVYFKLSCHTIAYQPRLVRHVEQSRYSSVFHAVGDIATFVSPDAVSSVC